jgi:hypothetical protein
MRRLRHTISLKVNGLSQIPAVANVTVHGDVVPARDTGQVILVRQRFQWAHARSVKVIFDMYLFGLFNATLRSARSHQDCPIWRFNTASEVTDNNILLGCGSDGSFDAVIVTRVHSW